jgi:electron transfer flavoprotein alpha subunit
VGFEEADGIVITVRSSSYTIEEPNFSGEIVQFDHPPAEEISVRKFIEYVEAAIGDVDITQADIVIGIGRGIKEPDNLKVVEELAAAIGGVLACSRPVVDAGWLPKDRQVGSSGKTIKPKLYIALGISGAFQHAAGMKGSETVVAVNKDCNAPIFGIADYGIVGDMFKVVPVLKQKIDEIKAS